MTGPYAQQQKMLLYVLPVVFAVGGIAFPIGVLFYWTTTNLWTMGQQFYVIRRNPAPGTPAYDAKLKRDRAKGRLVDRAGGAGAVAPADETPEPPRPPAPAAEAADQAAAQDDASGAQARGRGRTRRRHERGEDGMSETEQTRADRAAPDAGRSRAA